MHSKLTISTSFLLLAAFALFNVGMPVYSYLCPMMNGENPICDMWTNPPTGENAVTNQIGSCCAKVLVAERNTTPFLKTHESKALDDAFFPYTIEADLPGPQPVQNPRLDFALLQSEHSPPIFLLHSSLLI